MCYVLPDSNTCLYTGYEVQQLGDHNLTIAINEIYARHGLIFNDSDLTDCFISQSWYVPTCEFSDSEGCNLLNGFEQ